MNRDCSVLGIGSGVQTDTDQVFYCSAETETEHRRTLLGRTEIETEHPLAHRDRTETSNLYPETSPSSTQSRFARFVRRPVAGWNLSNMLTVCFPGVEILLREIIVITSEILKTIDDDEDIKNLAS